MLKKIGFLAIIGFSMFALLSLGPAIFEAAAPTGGRLMKFAVQRHRGVAIAATVLLVGLYVGIAIAGFLQRPARELVEQPSENQ